MEIFKTIKQYPMYRVSDKGRVLKVSNNTFLKPSTKRNGYQQVNLWTKDGRRKKEYIHRLVAMTFIPNENNYPQVNHIDRVRDNNEVSNLEWVTILENVRKSSVCVPIRVRKVNYEEVGVFPSIQQACKELGLTDSNISNCLHGGRQHTHKGYVFETIL